MKISRTHRATPPLSLPGPSSTEQHGVAEPRPNTNDSFESSRLKDTVTYGALGGLTASLPLLGLVSNSASLVANLKSGNDAAALLSGVATFLSIGSLVIPEGDAGLLPYIVPGVIGGIAWASYGYSQAS